MSPSLWCKGEYALRRERSGESFLFWYGRFERRDVPNLALPSRWFRAGRGVSFFVSQHRHRVVVLMSADSAEEKGKRFPSSAPLVWGQGREELCYGS